MSAKETADFEAAFGFAPELEVEVWPDVWDSYQVFSAMATQWRMGMNGPTGLDYSVLPQVMDMLAIEGDKATVFTDVRIMERKALEVFNRSS